MYIIFVLFYLFIYFYLGSVILYANNMTYRMLVVSTCNGMSTSPFFFRKDSFVISCGTYLGRLSKIRIGHDNTGFGAAWFLDKVGV